MGIQDFNSLIQNGLSYSKAEPIMGEMPVTTAQYAGGISMHRIGYTRVIETLPSGVISVIPTVIDIANTQTGLCILAGRATLLGSLDISGASGTFTPGSAMPTRTSLGASRPTWSVPIMEVTTALNSAPGSWTITYTDQDGNSGNATTSVGFGNSSVVGSAVTTTLVDGDAGVRSIEAASRSGGTTPTGVVAFYGIEPLCLIATSTAVVSNFQDDLIIGQTNMMEMVAGDSIIFYSIGNTANAKAILGRISYVGNN